MKASTFKSGNFIILVILAALFSNFNNYGQGTWQQKAGFGGSARQWAAGFAIGNIGYIGTGYDGSCKNDFWAFDPTTNVWTQKANFAGTPRIIAVGFAIGNKGYIGLGSDYSTNFYNDFWEYDPAGNTWNQIAGFPGTARGAATSFVIGNKAYVGTGVDVNNVKYNDFWEYDPTTNSWNQKANFGGAPQSVCVGFSIGSKGYVGIGFDGTCRSEFWEFDPVVNVWIQKANFPGTARAGAAGFAIGNKGYAGMGFNGISIFYNDLWQYDPTGNAWIQQPNFMGTARYQPSSFVIGNKGYVGIGMAQAGRTSDFFEFTPLVALPVELISFDANASSIIVKTNWSTASETNNNYFEIERSSDGKDFISIGKIYGAGNSTSTISYSFNDEQPLKGISYYRLKQTDYNGAFTYSKVKSVSFESNNNVMPVISLFPNPVTEKIFIKFNQENENMNQMNFIISNVNGMQVANKSFATMDNSSNNTYTFERGNLEAGTYFYQVGNGNHQVGSGKLIIQ